jgi:Ca2+-binding RTX toxin-like protein
MIQPYTTSSGLQLLLVTLTSTNSAGATILSQSGQYALSSVTYIYYYGQTGGSSSFQNLTAVSCTAYGGSGTNLLVGGSGNDTLYAGGAGSNNTLKGMGGDDTLVGGAGTNYMYGGTGNNTLIPGSGTNYMFPNG